MIFIIYYIIFPGDGCKLDYTAGKNQKSGKSSYSKANIRQGRGTSLLTPDKTYNITLVHAPQQGSDSTKKDYSCNQLEGEMNKTPESEEMVATGDLNRPEGKERSAFER